MLSIVTVASSTSMPTASARPPSVMMLSVSPIAERVAIAPRIASGIEVVTIRVERQLPRNKRIIRLVRAAAITPSRITPWIEARTNMDWSPIGLTSSASGSEGLMICSIFLMPLTMSSVEVAAVLEHAQEHRAIAVHVDDIDLHRTAVVHMRDVVHVDHGAAHALDRQVGELGYFRWRAVQVDGVFVIADLFRARRREEVLRGERVGDVLAGQAARLHRRGVEVEHHLRRLAAERPGDARALYRHQGWAHEVEAEIPEILLGQSLARERELDDGYGRGAVIDDQRGRCAGGHLLEQGLRNRGDLCVGGRDIGRWVEEDLDDAEGSVGVRLDVLDVVDRRRQCALERGDDAPGHIVGR